jgi:FtsP/CotA-like multicopper oxidase with cupredoxin domain
LQAKEIPRPSPEACKPLYPIYAPDLQDDALDAANAKDKVYTGNVTFTPTDNGCAVNGNLFSYPTSNPIPIPVGLVTEWNVGKLMFHPLHVHIQPFQIIELPPEVKDRPYTSWFKVRIDRTVYLHDLCCSQVFSCTLAFPRLANTYHLTPFLVGR